MMSCVSIGMQRTSCKTTESFHQLCECVLTPPCFVMRQTVLLLLSLLAVRCGGCFYERNAVINLITTIDSNPTGFVSKNLLTLYFYCFWCV